MYRFFLLAALVGCVTASVFTTCSTQVGRARCNSHDCSHGAVNVSCFQCPGGPYPVTITSALVAQGGNDIAGKGINIKQPATITLNGVNKWDKQIANPAVDISIIECGKPIFSKCGWHNVNTLGLTYGLNPCISSSGVSIKNQDCHLSQNPDTTEIVVGVDLSQNPTLASVFPIVESVVGNHGAGLEVKLRDGNTVVGCVQAFAYVIKA